MLAALTLQLDSVLASFQLLRQLVFDSFDHVHETRESRLDASLHLRRVRLELALQVGADLTQSRDIALICGVVADAIEH